MIKNAKNLLENIIGSTISNKVMQDLSFMTSMRLSINSKKSHRSPGRIFPYTLSKELSLWIWSILVAALVARSEKEEETIEWDDDPPTWIVAVVATLDALDEKECQEDNYYR